MPETSDFVKDLDEKQVDVIMKFVSNIRNGKLDTSDKIALATICLLEQIIIDTEKATAIQLCRVVRSAGQLIMSALPNELVAGNMVRRVLHAIRDEAGMHANQSSEGAGECLQRLVRPAAKRRLTLPALAPDLREALREHIAEIVNELESSNSSISNQASEHIHSAELVLTYGSGSLVERFLKSAANRNYRLIVAEGTCLKESHAMAARLSGAGIPVTVITNAAVCGVMSRVNKVIVDVRATLAGGAVLSSAGLHTVTTAAKYYSVPVIVLSPLYKLSPLYAHDQHHFNLLANPQAALPYENADSESFQIYAPLYDLVPPDHVTLFITNLGGSSPSYIYRLLSELYDPQDYQL